jgi:D-alanine-D-alanine ligase
VNILVLLGGDSSERDVSWASGVAVASALASRHHQVTGLDPAAGLWFEGADWHASERTIDTAPPETECADAASPLSHVLADARITSFDVVFIALHGGSGEDGTVQTLLGLTGVAYTGSGPLSSGLAMHKDTSKRLFKQAGVPTPDWVYPADSGTDVVKALGLPLIVKPVAEGSTVGLTLVKDAADLTGAVARAGDAMFEAFIPGRELSVGILGGRALPPVEIVPDHEIYDYECKYTDGMSEFLCPAPLDAAEAERVSVLAGRAFEALGCRGYARIDFRLAGDGTVYCLEANTLPGMTSHSLVPRAAMAAGMDFATLCETICQLAQNRAHSTRE